MEPNSVTEALVNRKIVQTEIKSIQLVGKMHTLVAVRLENGFTIIETSTCVDPANYNEEIGVEVCLKKIHDKIWMLEGYLLSERTKPMGGR